MGQIEMEKPGVSGSLLGGNQQRWLTIAILIYTLAQLYFLVRDKWWRDPERAKKRKGLCDVE